MRRAGPPTRPSLNPSVSLSDCYWEYDNTWSTGVWSGVRMDKVSFSFIPVSYGLVNELQQDSSQRLRSAAGKLKSTHIWTQVGATAKASAVTVCAFWSTTSYSVTVPGEPLLTKQRYYSSGVLFFFNDTQVIHFSQPCLKVKICPLKQNKKEVEEEEENDPCSLNTGNNRPVQKSVWVCGLEIKQFELDHREWRAIEQNQLITRTSQAAW